MHCTLTEQQTDEKEENMVEEYGLISYGSVKDNTLVRWAKFTALIFFTNSKEQKWN